jgi:cytochrome c oxidase subunit 4
MATDHKHPNYMAIFWWLTALTIIELAVVFLPFGKMVNGTMLCALAVGKAAIVAAYFMHLKFETKTLTWIAFTPLAIAVLLIFILMPDGFAVPKKTEGVKAVKTAPAAKH